jgi:putative phage-type endonuclease
MTQRVPGRHWKIEQGSEEWLELRKSKIATGSEFAAAVGLNPNMSRAKLWDSKANKCVPEIDSWRENAMAWGKHYESEARTVLGECFLEDTISEVGFYEVPDDARFGDSPDGILASTGEPVEIKCPYKLGNSLFPPKEYQLVQCLAHMAVTGKDRCHFFNYDPRGASFYYVIPWVQEDWDKVMFHLKVFASYVEFGMRPPPMKNKPRLKLTQLF